MESHQAVSENVAESTEAQEKATETKRHVANYILSEEELSKVTIQCVIFSNSNSKVRVLHNHPYVVSVTIKLFMNVLLRRLLSLHC